MGWSIGYDSKWKRDIGYGVPAYCDHPGCLAEIDRGLSYVCADKHPYGGEGCGRYYCADHRGCLDDEGGCPHDLRAPVSPEHPDWLRHVLTDESWQQWRDENPAEVAKARKSLGVSGGAEIDRREGGR